MRGWTDPVRVEPILVDECMCARCDAVTDGSYYCDGCLEQLSGDVDEDSWD